MDRELIPDYINRHLHITHWDGYIGAIDTSTIVQEVKEQIIQEGGGDIINNVILDAVVKTVSPPANNNLLWLDPNDTVLKYFNGVNWTAINPDTPTDANGNFTPIIPIQGTDQPPSEINVFWLDPSDTILKYYNGEDWTAVNPETPTDNTTPIIPVQTTANPPLENNVLWLDPSDTILKYFNGANWTSINEANDQGVDVQIISNDLEPPENNNIFWLDPNDSVLKYWNGTSWKGIDNDVAADWNGTDW